MAKRRFKKGRIDFLSLCHTGANNLSVVYKSQDKTRVVLKASEDKGEITALVYVPEVRDKQGEIASAPVIKDMAYGFAKNGQQIDILHNEEPVDVSRAFVAENFIVQKGDPRFQGWKDLDGNQIDPTGAWGVVIKVEDPALRALYRDGKWAGISMGGDGDFIDETKVTKTKEHTMTPEEIAALVQKSVAAALATAEADRVKKSETLKLPVFKGDISKASAKALREHAAAVKKARLFADVDMSDPEAVEAVAKTLEDEEKAVKKAKVSTLGGVSVVSKSAEDESNDEIEPGEVAKDDGEFIEVEVSDEDAHLSDAEIQRKQVVKTLLSHVPANRRVTVGK